MRIGALVVAKRRELRNQIIFLLSGETREVEEMLCPR
jgi:hypothetical protein